ncbi:hypothetical protein V8C34DRAFT_107292 [Trichoderma compactum]
MTAGTSSSRLPPELTNSRSAIVNCVWRILTRICKFQAETGLLLDSFLPATLPASAGVIYDDGHQPCKKTTTTKQTSQHPATARSFRPLAETWRCVWYWRGKILKQRREGKKDQSHPCLGRHLLRDATFLYVVAVAHAPRIACKMLVLPQHICLTTVRVQERRTCKRPDLCLREAWREARLLLVLYIWVGHLHVASPCACTSTSLTKGGVPAAYLYCTRTSLKQGAAFCAV